LYKQELRDFCYIDSEIHQNDREVVVMKKDWGIYLLCFVASFALALTIVRSVDWLSGENQPATILNVEEASETEAAQQGQPAAVNPAAVNTAAVNKIPAISN